MTLQIDLLTIPPTLEEGLRISHKNEIVVLDKLPYRGDLPERDYGLNSELVQSFKTEVPSPRANTYVLNLCQVVIEEESQRVTLSTNYTNMRSQFALRRWIPELAEESLERAKILTNLLPLGATIVMESADGKILFEERGKVEVPGKYYPAPAGGCETRDWRVFPEPFRSIKGEAWEETGLLPEDYGPLKLIGIVRDQTDSFNPTFIYHAISKMELDEIVAKAEGIAPEAGEHQRLFGVKATEEEILGIYLRNKEKQLGNGIGCILAFGKYKFGDLWATEAVKKLAESGGWRINQYDKTFP